MSDDIDPDRKFSNGTDWDNSIDWDDASDGSDGGYDRHGSPINANAMKELVQLRMETSRLRADLAAALAECERLNKSRNRWGKKYNDCLGKLRLAVMSDSDYVKEIDYQNTRLSAENAILRAERDMAIAERDRMREALKPFAAWCEAIDKFSFRMSDLRRARAAIEGVTEPANTQTGER